MTDVLKETPRVTFILSGFFQQDEAGCRQSERSPCSNRAHWLVVMLCLISVSYKWLKHKYNIQTHREARSVLGRQQEQTASHRNLYNLLLSRWNTHSVLRLDFTTHRQRSALENYLIQLWATVSTNCSTSSSWYSTRSYYHITMCHSTLNKTIHPCTSPIFTLSVLQVISDITCFR